MKPIIDIVDCADEAQLSAKQQELQGYRYEVKHEAENEEGQDYKDKRREAIEQGLNLIVLRTRGHICMLAKMKEKESNPV